VKLRLQFQPCSVGLLELEYGKSFDIGVYKTQSQAAKKLSIIIPRDVKGLGVGHVQLSTML